MMLMIEVKEDLFSGLVRGEIVTIPLGDGNTVGLALHDISWERMYYLIERAIRDHEHDQDSAAAAGDQQQQQNYKDERSAG